MKKYQIGNIIKTKKGDKCIIVDMEEKEAFVFNLSEMEPEKIKITDIKEKVGDANYTTVVINGKKQVRNQNEEEATEVDEEEIIEEEIETSEEDNDPTEAFGELMKLFGKAATELGNIFTKIAESDDCIYRGGLPIFGADHLVPDSLVSIKKKWRAKQPSSLTSDTLAHVLYLSACNSYERNKEIIVDSVGFGSLSYAISKAFEKYDLSNLYAWREAILDKMKKDVPFQSPQTRSSLSFDTIEVTESPIKISETRDSKITYIIVGVILTVLLFVLWIMKKVMK